jgi:hypothetical protein
MTDSPLSADLVRWGAVFKPATVVAGQVYWKLVEATGPQNIGGNHHLYVDVLDESGKRVVGVPVLFYSRDDDVHTKTEAKPGEAQAANLPLYSGGNAYGVRIDSGIPSDDLFGVGLGNYVDHQSFRAVFQRTIAGTTTNTPPPVPPTPPSLSVRETLERIRQLAESALELL